MNLSPSVGPRSCAIADVPMRVASRSRAISSCWAARPPPSAGGRRRARPRRPTTRRRSGARRCRRCPARPRRGRRGRCTRRRAAPGRGWPARRRRAARAGSRSAPRSPSSSRWLVGSSSSRQDGRVVMIVASASRVRWPPERVPTTGRARGRRARAAPPPPRHAGRRPRRRARPPPRARVRTPCRRPGAHQGARAARRRRRPSAAAPGSSRAPRRRWRCRGTAAPGRAARGRRGGDRSRDPGPRGQPSGDRAQEGRLADAVLADEADAAARLGEQVDPGQDRAVGVGDRQSRDHERRETGGGGREASRAGEASGGG